MEPEERLNNLRYLSETHRTLHERRRSVEMRVYITVLTLFGACAYALLKGDIKQEIGVAAIVGIWIAFLLIATISAGYLWRIHRANFMNIAFAEAVENEIVRKIACESIDKVVENDMATDYYRYWSWLWQAVTIYTFAIASAFVISITSPSAI